MDEITVASGVSFTAVKERQVGTPPRTVGPTIKVLVAREGVKKEALRLDPFPKGAHYHYFEVDAPQEDERDQGVQFYLDEVFTGDQVEWVLGTMLPKLPAMLRRAGYHAEAKTIAEVPLALAEAIDKVRVLLDRVAVAA